MDQGWGFPGLSRKAHYFVNARSLCLKWMFTGALEDTKDDHPDNCVACAKRVKKLRPAAEPAGTKEKT